jgi:hypothetical protein
MASGRGGMACLLREHELWGKLSYRKRHPTFLPPQNGQSPVGVKRKNVPPEVGRRQQVLAKFKLPAGG